MEQKEKRENWFLVVILILIIIASAGTFIYFYKPQAPKPSPLPTAYNNPLPSPTPSSSPISNSDCTSNQLKTTASFDTAAGNVYATLTIANISATDCEVTLGNSISAKYSATNITSVYKSSPPMQTYTLAAGAKVYSQVHYPNGPQCQSTIIQQPVTLTYGTDVNFDSFTISACTGPEKTQIDIWPVSQTPVTPIN